MSEKKTLSLKFRLEAILFASPQALSTEELTPYFPEQTDIDALIKELEQDYQDRGIALRCYGGKWALRTVPEAASFLSPVREEERKLSRAALETLSIIAYHQPVTRAEIESIRGVQVSRGTLDILMQCDWIKPGKRDDGLGRAMTWVTSDTFLAHFDLPSLEDLPGLGELRDAGFMPEMLQKISMENDDETPDADSADDEDNHSNVHNLYPMP